MKISWVLIIDLVILASAQGQPPRFEDYAVTEIFTGKPAVPLIETPLERMYRTRIREGAMKGWGVFRDGKEQPGPNFAGHYFVIQWGCGTACLMMVLADGLTGKIYYPPQAIGHAGNQRIGLPMYGFSPAEVEFRVASRLFKLRACPEQSNKPHAPCYSYDYLWQDNKWRQLDRVRLDDDPF
jgi:hypothetical protein